MIAMVLGAASSVKVAYATAGVLATSAGGWFYALVVGQESAASDPVGTLIPAAALTGTSAALVWVVKQIVGGNLVHRDPAIATAKLATALDRMNDIAEKAHEREALLAAMLQERLRQIEGRD